LIGSQVLKGFAKVAITICIIGLFHSSAALAMCNEEFAKQIREYETQLKGDEAFRAYVPSICGSLSESRHGGEPKCIALNKVALGSALGKVPGLKIR
jgi:hypothetical protein